jgi:hypothetical protein
MSIARRAFIKSGAIASLTAGVVLGAAKSIFGQNPVRTRIEKQPIVKSLAPPINDGYYAVPIEAQENPIFFFNQETFEPYVGDVFGVPDALGRMIPLQLASVAPYKVQPVTRLTNKKVRQPLSFSLLFTSAERLPQFTSIHKMNHAALGDFEIFLTSREIEGGVFLHEAVFNHLR